MNLVVVGAARAGSNIADEFVSMGRWVWEDHRTRTFTGKEQCQKPVCVKSLMATSPVVVSALLLILATGCGGNAEPVNLGDKLHWTEVRFDSDYYFDNPYPYAIFISGELTNVSESTLAVTSIGVRFYNQAGKPLEYYDYSTGHMKDQMTQTFDPRVSMSPGDTYHLADGWPFAEDVTHYQVFVTGFVTD